MLQHQKKDPSAETMSEAKKGDLAIRDKAILHQQRRLKQATQFSHKDSADLLPLDGLKRLGTSKDLVSGLLQNLNQRLRRSGRDLRDVESMCGARCLE